MSDCQFLLRKNGGLSVSVQLCQSCIFKKGSKEENIEDVPSLKPGACYAGLERGKQPRYLQQCGVMVARISAPHRPSGQVHCGGEKFAQVFQSPFPGLYTAQ